MSGVEGGPKDEHASSGDVLLLPVLLLNRHYTPISVITVRRAMVLLYCDIARALDEVGEEHDFAHWRRLEPRWDDDKLALVEGQLRVPRVLHLLQYDRSPRVVVRLTRRNLMLRDGFQCQYCARRPSPRDLNVDHVLPRSRGGMDSWENLVISCRPCNLKKGRRTPDEAGMRLLVGPQKPRWSTTAHILMSARAPFTEWQPFLEAG